jgi:hypothetical protein
MPRQPTAPLCRHTGFAMISPAGTAIAAAILACAAVLFASGRALADATACCTPSGVCSVLPSCPSGSTPAGQASCTPNPCTLSGRCCNFFTGGGTCTPNTCDQPGACCTGTACRRVTQAKCTGSTVWFPNVTCSPNPCPVPFAAKWTEAADPGARAVATFDLARSPVLHNPGNNDDGFGTVLTNLRIRVYGAASGNGTWTQADFSQMALAWNTALNTGIEWVGQPQSMGHWGVDGGGDFNLFGSTPGAPRGVIFFTLASDEGHGNAMQLASFAPIPARGACCAENGACTFVSDPECLVSGGTPLAAGTTCTPNPCILSGRCCNFFTGSCALTSQAACGLAAHTWASGGACSPNPCDQPGACCTGNLGACRRLTQAKCTGTWTAGACTPNPCSMHFAAKWASTTTSARAVATFDLAQPPLLHNPGDNSMGFGTVLKNLKIRVYGAAAGNGAWTQTDYGGMAFSWPVAVNTAVEWVGQPQDERSRWGVGAWDPYFTETHDFNLASGGGRLGVAFYQPSAERDGQLMLPTPRAPTGTYYYQLSANGGTGDTMLLTSFAPIPSAVGACCGVTGLCTIASNPECLVSGGAPAAAGTTCTPNPCPQPGTCCDQHQGCVFTLASTCASGSLWTLGGTCSPNPCQPIGPCCNFITGSCVITVQSTCGLGSHTWAAGGTCTPNACAQPGACCNTSLVCVRRTQAKCTGPTVTWTAGACVPRPCTLNGRCCNFITGSCAVTTQAACGLASHTWAFGGTCSPNPCAQPGACCIAGACRLRTQAQCTGTWSTGACTPNPCPVPFAAKWASTTTGARAVATFDLARPPLLQNPGENGMGFGTVLKNLKIRVYGAAAGNGAWAQADYQSMAFHWPVAVNTAVEWVGQPQDGRSRWGFGISDPNFTRTHDFNLFPGGGPISVAAYQPPAEGGGSGEGPPTPPPSGAPVGSNYYELTTNSGMTGEPMLLISFAPIPAARGACCAENGVCTIVSDPECLVSGGTPLPTGSTCTPNPCILSGRCCNFITGSCTLTAQAVCGLAAHTWAYGGTCSPTPCPLPGACCTGTACRRLTQAKCTGMSTWIPNAVCTPNPCLNSLAASSSTPCPADFDGSGSVDALDIFAFLNAWLAGGTVQDISEFLEEWFAGCP